MSQTIHLLKAVADDVAVATMRRQAEAGDRVIAVFLEGADVRPLPDAVTVRRVPIDVDYATLLELIFESDQVIAW